MVDFEKFQEFVLTNEDFKAEMSKCLNLRERKIMFSDGTPQEVINSFTSFVVSTSLDVSLFLLAFYSKWDQRQA